MIGLPGLGSMGPEGDGLWSLGGQGESYRGLTRTNTDQAESEAAVPFHLKHEPPPRLSAFTSDKVLPFPVPYFHPSPPIVTLNPERNASGSEGKPKTGW